MLGRSKQRQINGLQTEIETLRGDLIDFENTKALNRRLDSRIAVMERHVSDAQRGRETAQERALDYGRQIDRLAKWFQDTAPDQIGEGGAVDNALRLLDLVPLLKDEVARVQGENERFAEQLDGMNSQLADADRAIGMQDAEIKQLKLDLAAAQKKAATASTASRTTTSKSNVIKQ